MGKPLIFGVFQFLRPGGIIAATWRHPSDTSAHYLEIDHWTSLARRFEEAGLDFLFFADSYSYPVLDDGIIPEAVSHAIHFPEADPIVIVSAVAAATSTLGLVVTSSTTVEQPQAIARRYATLDVLTQGRIGWNIVTGAGQGASARLFGQSLIPHDRRYEMADDHVELTVKLWEGSWEDGALRVDKAAGVYADPARVHEISHDGPYFSARGTLTVPPSPQRTPLLFQAGTSRSGREFAAKWAEVVFMSGGDPTYIRENIRDIRRRSEELGREPGSVRFVIAASFLVGPTDEDARRKREEVLKLSTIEDAAVEYAHFTGLDLAAMDLDAPLGGVSTEQGQSNVDRFTGVNDAPVPTVREILEEYRRNGAAGTTFVGSPSTVADEVERFVAETEADGFLIQPLFTPDTYEDFIELLLPELRRRGLAADQPEGTTLREHIFGTGHRELPDDHPGRSLLKPSPEPDGAEEV